MPQIETACAAPAEEEARLADLRRDSPSSFGAMFLERSVRTPDAPAYRTPGADGAWVSRTWSQTAAAVTEIAAGLLTLGLRPEDRVAICSATRVEWIEADFGVMCAAGATTTVYPSSSPEEVMHILTDSGSRFAIAENGEHLAKLLAEGSPVEHAVIMDGTDERALPLEELRARGRAALERDPGLVTRTTAAIRPDDLATLIYTPGTTGLPKGVRVAHDAWIYQGLAIQAMGIVRPDDLGYLWLPLSHAFGKALLSC